MDELQVLVTGVGGYIGSVLARVLLEKGYSVLGVDNFLYGNQYSIDSLKGHQHFELVFGDITDKAVVDFLLKRDVEVVVHLAGIVGQPACSLDVERAVRVNLDATISLAEGAIRQDVEHFIFASTCSVYGKNNSTIVDETIEPNPLDMYAKTKYHSEQRLLSYNGNGLPVTILRFATNYGISHRMRFDLVVNYFVMKAWRDKQITVLGGTQWRPLISVQDSAQAIYRVMKDGRELTGETFNVGGNKQNYTIAEVAEIVRKCVSGTQIENKPEITDNRSYSVDFTKIQSKLGFEPEVELGLGISQISSALKEGVISNPADSRYYNTPN